MLKTGRKENPKLLKRFLNLIYHFIHNKINFGGTRPPIALYILKLPLLQRHWLKRKNVIYATTLFFETSNRPGFLSKIAHKNCKDFYAILILSIRIVYISKYLPKFIIIIHTFVDQ